MNYDPQRPIAVFLGPSLETSQAGQILKANYYPPARMGDIYRILASGVRIIVLIDGVFHREASVWPRELLEALDNNIRVIGASSMGALRAAELFPFGMIGQGTIFEWYCAGIIEGDDEVALNHGDESVGFRPFSEPLVNIRYNLQQAVTQKCISANQAAALIEYAKNSYYADRSYDFLLNSPVVQHWPRATQDSLSQFICQQAVNLKQQDAVGALKYCAGLGLGENQRLPHSSSLRTRGRYYRLVRVKKRGFLDSEGRLVKGETLLAAIWRDEQLIRTLRPVLTKNYFLLLWTQQREIECPPDYLETYRQAWHNNRSRIDGGEFWLRANGLTKREFQSALAKRALLTWLVEQKPGSFGLDFEPYLQFVMALRDLSPSCDHPDSRPPEQKNPVPDRHTRWLRQAAEICYLAAWAKENGITCPSAYAEQFIKRWEETHQILQRATWLNTVNMTEAHYLSLLADWACADWLIEQGPAYFGYRSWSFEVALLEELQITGQAAQIIKKMTPDPQ